MSKILILGGTGFAGSHIASEAVKRGHDVIVLSRSAPEKTVSGVEYVQGSALDRSFRQELLSRSDVVVGAVSPRGDMAGRVSSLYEDVAADAAQHNVRFVIIGGFSSLRQSKDEPRFFENGNVPEEFRVEAEEIANLFDTLKSSAPTGLRWVFISPAMMFGAYATVEDTGTYRVSDDVAIYDENGESKISGADFAIGAVDEIENPEHDSQNISFAH